MRGVHQLVWLGTLACQPAIHEPPDAIPPGKVAVHPGFVGRGVTLPFTLTSESPVFVAGDTTLSFGDGLTVRDVSVRDERTVVATVQVDSLAVLGPRDVSVDVGTWTRVLDDAVVVSAESLTISPNFARPGQIVAVEFTGRGTAWNEYSWARFGEGVHVVSMEEIGVDFALAHVAIDPDAVPGMRDVSIDEVTLYDGFTIDREGVAADLDIEEVPQGASLDFTLSGSGTAWTEDTTIAFWDDGGLNPDLSIPELRVIDGQHLTGTVRASNAAVLGMRDVVISTGDQRVYLSDELRVTETTPTLEDVALIVKWHVRRDVDDRGQVTEAELAYAVFVVPLDPPCGGPSPGGIDPTRYDIPVFSLNSIASSPEDCPTPKTMDAGDTVWLRNGSSVVGLTRVLKQGGAFITYEGLNLTAADYPFGQTLDFVTSGSDQIPAMVVPGILPTVPADVTLLDASGRLHSRSGDLPVNWTPAQSYPHSLLSLLLHGRVSQSTREATVSVIPWDDGSYAIPSVPLTRLAAGDARIVLTSSVEGREFNLPFTDRIQPLATSSVSMTQRLVLE